VGLKPAIVENILIRQNIIGLVWLKEPSKRRFSGFAASVVKEGYKEFDNIAGNKLSGMQSILPGTGYYD